MPQREVMQPWDYAGWVRERKLQSGGQPPTADALGAHADPDQRGFAVVASPNDEAVTLIDDARRSGCGRIVCGFLPDEIDWPAAGLGVTLTFLLRRFEFVPWELPPADVAEPSTHRGLLLVSEKRRTDSTPVILDLCRAAAQALQLPLVNFEVGEGSPVQLSQLILAARVVVNDVSDWSIGFGIDLWAARKGVRCVRLRQPGYSPLRYALLRQTLPSEAPGQLPRLRELGLLDPAPPPVANSEMLAWFRRDASERWRSIFNPGTFRSFWAESRFAPPERGAGSAGGNRWLDRPLAWAGLRAAMHGETFPAEAAARAMSTMTEWLAGDRRHSRGGTVRRTAVVRWSRMHPEWLKAFCEANGANNDTKLAVARWATKAILLPEIDPPTLPVLRAATTALGDPATSSLIGRLIFSWYERPQAVAELTSQIQSSVVIHAVCVEAFIAWLEAHPTESLPEESWRAMAELADNQETWSISFGVAAPVLRALCALRCGRRNIAVRAWRQVRAVLGMVGKGAPACASFVRSLWHERQRQRTPWIRREILKEADEQRLPRLLWRWHHARADDLWRRHVDPVAQRELSRAIEALRWAAAARNCAVPVSQMAVFLALAGRAQEAVAELIEARAKGEPLGATPEVVSLAMWCRGMEVHLPLVLVMRDEKLSKAAWPLFLRAVIFQLLGKTDDAMETLARLREVSPRYLAMRTVADARWAWASIVFARAGHVEQGAEFRAIARRGGFDLGALWLEASGDDGVPLATGWAELT